MENTCSVCGHIQLNCIDLNKVYCYQWNLIVHAQNKNPKSGY